jgi:circadian clock protein KaiC
LGRWVERGLLRFYTARPGAYSLEKHLVTIHNEIVTFDPDVVVIDPVTNFAAAGSRLDVKSMVTRLIDMFKSRQITAMFTSLTSGDSSPELSEIGVSSQMDAWLLLRNLECNGERNRGLYILKSCGMAHSNQIREFVLTGHGVQLLDVYVGPGGLLTGSARVSQEARERAETAQRAQEVERKGAEMKHKRQRLQMEIAAMQSKFAMEEQDLLQATRALESREEQIELGRTAMVRARGADAIPNRVNGLAQ